jgi:hypothetical protein
MITTYTELKAAIAAWLNRTDLTAQIPTFVQLAHTRLNRDLRLARMETRANADTSAGDPMLVLPDDFLEMRSVRLVTEPPLVLRAANPAEIEAMGAISGKPSAYATIGRSLRLAPTPDAPITVALTYYAAVPALSEANGNNWLLTEAPDVYLYAALAESAPYLHEDARVQTWAALYDRALDSLRNADLKARWGGSSLASRPTRSV